MELKNVLLEKEEHLAIVTINRPKALNAYKGRNNSKIIWYISWR